MIDTKIEPLEPNNCERLAQWCRASGANLASLTAPTIRALVPLDVVCRGCVLAGRLFGATAPVAAAVLWPLQIEPALAQTATITPLPPLFMPSSAMSGSNTTAVSNDGSVIVGEAVVGLTPSTASMGSFPFSHAFSWTPAGVPTDLGSFLGATGNSFANGVSADGSTIVGQSDTSFLSTAGTAAHPLIAQHAFVIQSGLMTDLGTLVGPTGTSQANGVAVTAAGTFIVGTSDTSQFVSGQGFTTLAHAVLWTSGASSITDLGTLPTTSASRATSVANAISADGSTIVGQSTTSGTQTDGTPLVHGVRWSTSAPTPMELFPITGVTGFSSANAVNSNGSVIVGTSQTNTTGAILNTDPNTPPFTPTILSHAVVWTPASNVAQDLGVFASTPAQQPATFPVSSYSYSATGVSADGTVIVGTYTVNAGDSFPANPIGGFRRTVASGLQDLQTLLVNAGVVVGGIQIQSATAISGNGQFIVGAANFPGGGGSEGYVVRYVDATVSPPPPPVPPSPPTPPTPVPPTPPSPPTPPIAGLTTSSSVQNSVDQLAAARRMILVQEFGLSAQILGANERIGSGSEVGVFAAAGTADSLDGGGNFRVAFGNGFSLLGGLNVASEHYDNVKTDDVLMGALALRYVYDTGGAWRPFAEVGGWGVPDSTFTFSRGYANGVGTAIGRAGSTADKFYVYGRAGAVFAQSVRDEVAVSLEIGHAELHTGAFAEAMSSANPFEASGPAATDAMTIGKIRGQWTHNITEQLDATVWAAVANGFDTSTQLKVGIPGFGVLTPGKSGHPTWAEYGGRVGYKIRPNMIVDVFADGVSGDKAIGTDVHVGAGFRYAF